MSINAYGACYNENPTWSNPEKWVWQQICSGDIADFNKKLKKVADIHLASDWDDRRLLSSKFIYEVLLDKRYSDSIPDLGLRIKGFWINAPVDLTGAEINPIIWFDKGRFEKEVTLTSARLDHSLTFDGSYLGGVLRLDRATVDGRVSLNHAYSKSKISFMSADIKHDITFIDSVFKGGVDFNGASIASNLKIYETNIEKGIRIRANIGKKLEIFDSNFMGSFDLINASIGHVYFGKSVFDGKFFTTGMTVKNGIFLSKGVVFKGKVSLLFNSIGSFSTANDSKFENEVLISGHVGNTLDLSGSTFKGEVKLVDSKIGGFLAIKSEFKSTLICNLVQVKNSASFSRSIFHKASSFKNFYTGDHLSFREAKTLDALNIKQLKIGGNLWLSNGNFPHPIYLSDSMIAGDLLLEGASLNILDLSNTKVGGTLSLWSKDEDSALQWVDSSESESAILLYNTKVHILKDHQDYWPSQVDLLYFDYEIITGPDYLRKSKPRPVTWYIDWLGRTPHYFNPQPYVHLESILKKMGRLSDMRKIRYAREDEARDNIEAFSVEYIWLSVLKWCTGYGQSLERILIAFIGLVFCGMLVLRFAGESKKNQIKAGFEYSLEQALPIVNLNKKFEDIQLGPFQRYWFYFQIVSGYFLATLLLGGLLKLYS